MQQRNDDTNTDGDAEIGSLLAQAEAIFNDPDAVLAKYEEAQAVLV